MAGRLAGAEVEKGLSSERIIDAGHALSLPHVIPSITMFKHKFGSPSSLVVVAE